MLFTMSDPRVDAMSEAAFQATIVKAAKLLGLECYHTHNSRRSEPGWPDLVIVGATGVMFRELKTMTGKVSPAQFFWLGILQDVGLDVDVWRPDQWPDQIVAELKTLGRVQAIKPVKKKPMQSFPGFTLPQQRKPLP